MTRTQPIASEVRAIRGTLDALAVETSLLRLQGSLRRKYSVDQPRAPAGQPDGGRWTSGEGATGSGPGSTTEERTLTADGAEVLTIRIRADRGDWDEQHTVTDADGESRIFETSGPVQTIREGADGTVLGRSTFTPNGASPITTVQPAFPPEIPAVIEATIQLAGTLFAVLASRDDRFGTAVLGMSAQEYKPGAELGRDPAIWVGRVDQTGLDAACPRNAQVQAMTDRVAASVRASGGYTSPQDFGNKVHAQIAKIVDDQEDPTFVAEHSFNSVGADRPYSEFGTKRLDLLEKTVDRTVCIYDYKTGRAVLQQLRAIELATVATRRFPDTTRIIVIQVKPRP